MPWMPREPPRANLEVDRGESIERARVARGLVIGCFRELRAETARCSERAPNPGDWRRFDAAIETPSPSGQDGVT
jgi:hypothetical protein